MTDAIGEICADIEKDFPDKYCEKQKIAPFTANSLPPTWETILLFGGNYYWRWPSDGGKQINNKINVLQYYRRETYDTGPLTRINIRDYSVIYAIRCRTRRI